MRFTPAISLLVLSACARDDTIYPSLAQRPAERRGFAEPEAPASRPPRADPALDARVAALDGRLGTIVAGFDRDVARAETAAARAGVRTVGGDAWIAAQTALALLNDWRAQAAEVATDAAEAASARAAVLDAPYPALERLGARAAAEVERQDARIRAIGARLPEA